MAAIKIMLVQLLPRSKFVQRECIMHLAAIICLPIVVAAIMASDSRTTSRHLEHAVAVMTLAVAASVRILAPAVVNACCGGCGGAIAHSFQNAPGFNAHASKRNRVQSVSLASSFCT